MSTKLDKLHRDFERLKEWAACLQNLGWQAIAEDLQNQMFHVERQILEQTEDLGAWKNGYLAGQIRILRKLEFDPERVSRQMVALKAQIQDLQDVERRQQDMGAHRPPRPQA